MLTYVPIFLPKGQKSSGVNEYGWKVNYLDTKCLGLFSYSREGKDLSPLMLFDSSSFLPVVTSVIDDTFRKANGEPQCVCQRRKRPSSNHKLLQHTTLGPTSEGCTNTLNSEQKPAWETSAIPSRFVLYPLNSKGKHDPPIMCFPSCYWPPLAAPLPSPCHKKQHLAGCVVSGPLIGLSQQICWRDWGGTTLLFKSRPVIPACWGEGRSRLRGRLLVEKVLRKMRMED